MPLLRRAKVRLKNLATGGRYRWLTFSTSMQVRRTPGHARRAPDFTVAGVQKGGTTWVYHALSRREDVYLPVIDGTSDPTEVRFFDERLHLGLHWYRRLYEGGSSLLCGDKTPKYYLMDESRVRLMHRWNPAMKVVFSVRHPAERAWSQAVMNLERFNGVRFEDDPARYFRFLEAAAFMGEYSRYLERWARVFGRDQVLVLDYHDLARNPRGYWGHLRDFLELAENPASEPDFATRANPNPHRSMPAPVSRWLETRFAPEVQRLRADYRLRLV